MRILVKVPQPTDVQHKITRVMAIGLALCAWMVSPVRSQAPVIKPGAQFVASSQGRVYYWVGCSGWHRLSQAQLRFFRTAAEAEKAGLRPSRTRGCAPQVDTALIQAKTNGTAQCTVERIPDGDTFHCRGGSRVRLLITDAAEIGQSEYADSAKLALHELMPEGSRVTLQFDTQLYDRYGRLLAHAYADGVWINYALARRGLAHIALYGSNVRGVDTLRAAVDSARQERRGIWAGSAFCTPANYRAAKCK